MPTPLKLLNSVYVRMFLVVCVAAIPSFIGLSIYVQQHQNYLTELNKSNIQNYIDLAAHDESWIFNSTRQTLRNIASVPVIKDGNWAKCDRYLASLLKEQSVYNNFGIIDTSGKALCSGLNKSQDAYPNLGDRDYFQRALNSSGLVVGAFRIGRLTGLPTIVIATALKNDNNTVRGVIYASLDLNAMVQTRHSRQLSSDASLLVLDRNGTVLYAAPADEATIGKTLANKDILEQVSFRERGSAVIKRSDGSEWFISHTHAGPPEDPKALTILYQHSNASLLTNVNYNLWVSATIVVLLIMATLVIGWIGTQAVLGRNLRFLTSSTKRLRQRDWSTRIGNVVTGLEFKEIALQFDQMAQELDNREQQWETSLQQQQSQSKILQLITQDHPLGDILNELTRFIETQINGSLASIVRLNPDTNRVRSCIASSLPKTYTDSLINVAIESDAQSWAAAIHQKKTVIVHDFATDLNPADYREQAIKHGLQACWSSPILSSHGQVLGALVIYYRSPKSPLPEDLQLAATATELAAIAIEHRRQSRALAYQARHDSLTGLYNREVLALNIRQTIDGAYKNNIRFYVVIMDLDGFKEINTTLGRIKGDALLKQVSNRLQSVYSLYADIARSDGDEFTFFIVQTPSLKPIDTIAQDMLRHVKQPFLLDGIQVQISASIGIACYPDDGRKPGRLLRRADAAMHQAKRESSGYAHYDAKNDQDAPTHLVLMSHLRQALSNNQFVLYYQPKIALKDKSVIGYEALLRWQTQEQGLIFPSDFMPAMERSDLIHPITLWVLNTAIAQCKRWHLRGHKVTIAINVSARNLLDMKLPEKIEEILTRHQLEPYFLELEITESSIMADPSRSLTILTQIRNIGVRVAIDDFGTGYSSLTYLQKLPVDNLKIDQSFVRTMNSRPETQSIVSTIINLAHNLSLSTTAEGVEDSLTQQKLAELGCNYAQGFFIARPMSNQAVEGWRMNGHGNIAT